MRQESLRMVHSSHDAKHLSMHRCLNGNFSIQRNKKKNKHREMEENKAREKFDCFVLAYLYSIGITWHFSMCKRDLSSEHFNSMCKTF